jgi:hypothetical protein
VIAYEAIHIASGKANSALVALARGPGVAQLSRRGFGIVDAAAVGAGGGHLDWPSVCSRADRTWARNEGIIRLSSWSAAPATD